MSHSPATPSSFSFWIPRCSQTRGVKYNLSWEFWVYPGVSSQLGEHRKALHHVWTTSAASSQHKEATLQDLWGCPKAHSTERTTGCSRISLWLMDAYIILYYISHTAFSLVSNILPSSCFCYLRYREQFKSIAAHFCSWPLNIRVQFQSLLQPILTPDT